MKKTNGFWRFPVAFGLVNIMLALPLSHAAAEQRQPYVPRYPYSSQEQQEEQEPSVAAQWFSAAFMAGLLYCAWTDCIAGANPAESTPRHGRPEEGAQKPESARPDTSQGCAWGDRLFNTCH